MQNQINVDRVSVTNSVTRTENNSTHSRVFLALLFALIVAILTACGTVSETPEARKPDVPTPAVDTWANTDVGDVVVPGGFEVVASDEVVVQGSGDDIWGTADSFHFLHSKRGGEVVASARVAVIEYENDWAKVGVMVRGSLDAGAPHAFMGVTPAGVLEFIWRASEGGESDSTVLRVGEDYSGWVRLVREGDRLEGFTSIDGEQWESFAVAEVPLGESTQVGVAVTSRGGSSLTEAVVQSLQVGADGLDAQTPAPSPEPQPVPTPEPDPAPGTSEGAWVCPAGSEALLPRYAPTYFVAVNGSDNNDGRSEGAPFRTLSRAADVVQPGDVVWVREGVYHERVDFERSGTASNPIVFESYPGECAIIDGANLGNARPVTFWSVQHMIFRNFVVRNSPMEGIVLSGSHNNRISNVHTHGHFWSGIQMSNSNDNTFAYFVTSDNFNSPAGGDADGISVSSGNGNRIEHCIAYNNSDDGIDTWRSTNTVIDSCIAYNNGWQGGDGNGFKAGGPGDSVNTIVQNSIAFGNRANGFDINTGVNVRFYNNTAVDNGRYNFVADQTTVLQNNISMGGELLLWGANDSYNSWNLGIEDPAFVSLDPNSRDFLRLSADSPAIDAGVDVGLPFQGSAPDLGAIPRDSSYVEVIGGVLQNAVVKASAERP